MLQLLASPDCLPFTVAIILMLFLSLLELASLFVGVGLGDLLDSLGPDVGDIDVDADSPTFLGWLGIGKVPLIMVLLIFLTTFGLTGFILQSTIRSVFPFYLPWYLAIWAPLIISLPVIRLLTGLLSKILIKDETEAVSENSFIGQVAVIIRGTAKCGQPAEAKLQDRNGCTHYLIVEPQDKDSEFNQSQQVLIVSKDGALYKAIEAPASVLTP